MPVNPYTCTGEVRWVLVWSPSCPNEFAPQAHTVPSPFSAIVCDAPEATCVTFDSVDITAGVVCAVVVPSPS
jgi:hypothetical protein